MGEFVTPSIKVVLFDHDDTLVGTIEPKWAQHKYIAKQYYGKNLTDDEIKQHWGKPLTELMCLLYGTSDADTALAYTLESHQNYPKKLFTATIPTLKRLKQEGKLVGVVTATSRFSFEHDLELHNVPKKLLDYTQTAEDTSFHKPNPQVFTPALEWLAKRGVMPEEVLYVGDGLHDMQAALGVSFKFLGVETGLVSAKDFASQGAKSIEGIQKLFENQ